jgi:hypothetical protein
MYSTGIPFPSSASGKENVTVSRGGKRTRHNALMDGKSHRQNQQLRSDYADDAFNTVTGFASTPARIKTQSLPVIQEAYPPSLLQAPAPRITILANPAKSPSLPKISENGLRSASILQPPFPPRITILANPARTRTQSLPTIQESMFEGGACTTEDGWVSWTGGSECGFVALASVAKHSPPRITILSNPARARSLASTEKSQNTQNASGAAHVLKRALNSISILKAPASAQSRRGVGTATSATSKWACPRFSPPKTGKPATKTTKGERKEKAKPLPKIVIHEPDSWDVWRDVLQPGTSYGDFLDVPAVNGRGKMYDEDFARFYPREYSADQTMRRLRKMVRSGNRQSAAGRRKRARQCREAAAPIITQTADDDFSYPTSFLIV